MSGFFVPHNLKTPLKGASGGPLAGLTAAVKDMYDIAGERAGGGNPDWLANTRPAAANAIAVDKILGAGATIIGKTICDEFFYSVAGINAHYGTPANLRAPGRIPGGSSSGSAAATAAGACDFALGSDTGGSVRIPASFCGLYGMRTTHGRVDTKGCMDMAPSFDTIGWFANGPGVFRRVGDVLLGGEAVRANVGNLLIADDGFAEADEAVVKLLRSALDRMKGDSAEDRTRTARARRSRSVARSGAGDPGLRDLAGVRPLRRRKASEVRPRRRRAHDRSRRPSRRRRPMPQAPSAPPRATTCAA